MKAEPAPAPAPAPKKEEMHADTSSDEDEPPAPAPVAAPADDSDTDLEEAGKKAGRLRLPAGLRRRHGWLGHGPSRQASPPRRTTSDTDRRREPEPRPQARPGPLPRPPPAGRQHEGTCVMIAREPWNKGQYERTTSDTDLST